MNKELLKQVISHKQFENNVPSDILNTLVQKAGSQLQTTVARTKEGQVSSVTVAFRQGDMAFAHTVPGVPGTEDGKAHIKQLKTKCCEALLDQHGNELCQEVLKRQADHVERYTTQEIIEMARTRWPQAFDEANPLPLTKGVNQVVMEALALNTSEVRKFFKHWCSKRAYLANTVKTKQRINLDGSPAEAVVESEVQWALTRLPRFKVKAKRAVEPEQQDAKKLYNSWAARWPVLFSRDNPLPINRPSVVRHLKAETGLPHEIIITTLKWWSRRIEYRTACATHTEMFDLNLTPVPKEAQHLLQPSRG